jgi:hypothetical protein
MRIEDLPAEPIDAAAKRVGVAAGLVRDAVAVALARCWALREVPLPAERDHAHVVGVLQRMDDVRKRVAALAISLAAIPGIADLLRGSFPEARARSGVACDDREPLGSIVWALEDLRRVAGRAHELVRRAATVGRLFVALKLSREDLDDLALTAFTETLRVAGLADGEIAAVATAWTANNSRDVLPGWLLEDFLPVWRHGQRQAADRGSSAAAPDPETLFAVEQAVAGCQRGWWGGGERPRLGLAGMLQLADLLAAGDDVESIDRLRTPPRLTVLSLDLQQEFAWAAKDPDEGESDDGW